MWDPNTNKPPQLNLARSNRPENEQKLKINSLRSHTEKERREGERRERSNTRSQIAELTKRVEGLVDLSRRKEREEGKEDNS